MDNLYDWVMRRVVERNGPLKTKCLIFVGRRTSGYGDVGRGVGRSRAHRVTWVRKNGPIPEGMCVLHRCDVRACVNPKHLFLGTRDDNNKDMKKKGRNARGPEFSAIMKRCAARGEQHYSRRTPERVRRGNACPWAVLTEAQVRKIKGALRGGRSQKELAVKYGVAYGHISKIALGQRWGHVR